MSIWSSVRPLTWSPTTSFSLNWRDRDFTGGLFGSEEFVGWSHPGGSGQRFDVQMEIGNKWWPSVVHFGTDAVQYLHQ